MSELPKPINDPVDQSPYAIDRVVSSSRLAKIPIYKVEQIAKEYINGSDYEMFMYPYIVDKKSVNDIAEQLGADAKDLDEVIRAYEDFIMDKYLEVADYFGYGHAHRINEADRRAGRS